MVIHNKLVRDLIPEVIEAAGKTSDVKFLDLLEHKKYLDVKLGEEMQEYLDSDDISELADLVEVVYGILHVKGCSVEEFETIRLAKKEERGGFEKGVFLISVQESK